MFKLQRIAVNFTGNVHYDNIGDRKYLVAPMVMLTEGVHEGSNGLLYYPKEEISKTPQAWNHKPVILYHPQAEDGEGISACDPVILGNRQVGIIMNARVGNVQVKTDGEKKKRITALKAEAWLDEERADAIDERIMQAVEKNEIMELSTGLFTDNESESGEWNGETYDAIARNYRPDHLALLPDLKGACSVEDGAGFLRLNAKPDKILITSNEMSHSNIRSLLNSWLQDKDEDVWVEDVYPEFFIFMKDGKLFKGNYQIVNNVLQVENEVEEVVRVTEYRAMNGEFVGNENDDVKRKEFMMQKEKTVEALIKSNSNSWLEADRKTLMEMEDSVLTKMTESEKLAAEKAVENAIEEAEKNEAEKAKKKAAEATAKGTQNADDKPKTVDEYINDGEIPQAMQRVMRSGVATYNAITKTLVKRILDNEKNQFTEEQLQAKDNDELKQLGALMTSSKTDEDEEDLTMNFEALGIEPTGNEEKEPLQMPAIVGT